MINRAWSVRVIVRYLLFQIPSVVLFVLALILAQRWISIPAWLFWGLITLWVLKDIIMYPMVWRAYDTSGSGENSMVGARGVAENRLAPSGYIRVRGELWQTEVLGGGPPIERGTSVQVREVNGLTLLVQPDDEASES
jgi:membrane protein implicated in regulation of membrane protease activity